MPSLTSALTYVKLESDALTCVAPVILACGSLLTGRPGCGKTTVLRAAAQKLASFHPVGFYTEEIRAGREPRDSASSRSMAKKRSSPTWTSHHHA